MTKEKDMYEPLKQFLLSESPNYKIYAEVGVIDVVVIDEESNNTHIIEMKKNFNIKLFEQSHRALNYANEVSILILEPKGSYLPRGINIILNTFGIGVYFYSEKSNKIIQHRKPRYRESSTLRYDIKKNVTETHMKLKGGVKTGEGKTLYSLMMDDIVNYLKEELMKDMLDDSIEESKKGYRLAKDIIQNVPTVADNYSKSSMEGSLKSTLQQHWNKSRIEKTIINRKLHFRYIRNGSYY